MSLAPSGLVCNGTALGPSGPPPQVWPLAPSPDLSLVYGWERHAHPSHRILRRAAWAACELHQGRECVWTTLQGLVSTHPASVQSVYEAELQALIGGGA
eukprot:3110361-Amphidinium_carterae.2